MQRVRGEGERGEFCDPSAGVTLHSQHINTSAFQTFLFLLCTKQQEYGGRESLRPNLYLSFSLFVGIKVNIMNG